MCLLHMYSSVILYTRTHPHLRVTRCYLNICILCTLFAGNNIFARVRLRGPAARISLISSIQHTRILHKVSTYVCFLVYIFVRGCVRGRCVCVCVCRNNSSRRWPTHVYSFTQPPFIPRTRMKYGVRLKNSTHTCTHALWLNTGWQDGIPAIQIVYIIISYCVHCASSRVRAGATRVVW